MRLRGSGIVCTWTPDRSESSRKTRTGFSFIFVYSFLRVQHFGALRWRGISGGEGVQAVGRRADGRKKVYDNENFWIILIDVPPSAHDTRGRLDIPLFFVFFIFYFVLYAL